MIQINEVQIDSINVGNSTKKASNDVFLANQLGAFLNRRPDFPWGGCIVFPVFLTCLVMARIRFSRCELVLGTFLVLSISMQARAGDAIRGQELAAMWCRACHLPGENRPANLLVAPPLEEVAQRSNIDAKTLTQLLMAPHPVMPDRGLSRDEADDIAAYLLSLQK